MYFIGLCTGHAKLKKHEKLVKKDHENLEKLNKFIKMIMKLYSKLYMSMYIYFLNESCFSKKCGI